jgi:hypothetical protein
VCGNLGLGALRGDGLSAGVGPIPLHQCTHDFFSSLLQVVTLLQTLPYIKLVGTFPGPCASGSYVHEAALLMLQVCDPRTYCDS